MKVRIVQVPVSMLDVTRTEDRFSRVEVGSWDLELVVVDPEMTLEEAQAFLRNGTVFRLKENGDL